MSLRLAVALPSLEPRVLQRQELDAAIEGMAHAGVEIECFAEATRLRESEPHLRRWHYLRMSERHAQRPFDAALYPLGRDYRPYEPSWILMHQFPGTVWVLDQVLHHLVVGGMVLRGRWDAYRRAVDAAFAERAAVLSDVLASWWTTSSFYGRHDPVPPSLIGQQSLIACSDAIRDAWNGPPFAATVPLPRLGTPHGNTSPRTQRIAVLTLNLVRPEPVLRGLQMLSQRCADVEITVVAPELVYEHRLQPACDRFGGLDTVSWLVGTDWLRMRELVENSDAVAFLRADLTTAEAALLRLAMDTGTLVVVADTPSFADIPSDAAIKGSLGEEMAHWLPEILSLVRTETSIAVTVSKRAAGFRAGQPDRIAVGESLRRQLRATGGLTRVDLSAQARARLSSRLRRLLPRVADLDTPESAAGRALREALGPRWWPQDEPTTPAQ